MKALLTFLAATLLAVACGSSAPAATATPSPSQAQLGAEYLKLVAPSNAANDSLNVALKITPFDGPKVRTAATDLRDSEATFNTALFGFEKKVPANVQADVETARHSLSTDISNLYNVVNSADDASLNAALAAWPALPNAPFVQLRSDLGLPPPT